MDVLKDRQEVSQAYLIWLREWADVARKKPDKLDAFQAGVEFQKRREANEKR